MIDSEQGSGKRCPREVDIVAFLQDELTRGQKQTFEKHLATCSSCAKEIEPYRKLIGRLLTPLPAMPTRDLTPDILARIPSPLRERRGDGIRARISGVSSRVGIAGKGLSRRPISFRYRSISAAHDEQVVRCFSKASFCSRGSSS